MDTTRPVMMNTDDFLNARIVSAQRFTSIELEAIHKAEKARDALTFAIGAYVAAGFGSHVIEPLRVAQKQVAHSLSEVQS